MNKLFQNPQHRANLSYNGFDLSQRVLFSSPTGQLLPVYWHFLDPGDKVTINTELKTRTMDLLSSAFGSINEHVEWFFVPIQQLYKFFGDVYNNIQDIDTNLVDISPDSSTFPHFQSWFEYFNNFFQSLLSSEVNTYSLESTAFDSLRLMHMLGYPVDDCLRWLGVELAPNTAGVKDMISANHTYSPLPLLAYQKIYSDFYRLSDREQNSPSSYNCDNFWIDYPVQFDLTTLLRYRPIRKDYFTNRLVSPLQGSNDIGSLGLSIRPNLDTNIPTDVMTVQSSGSPSDYQPSDVYGQIPLVSGGSDTMSLTAIRAMFAHDKLLAITRRSGKHYDAQTLAHFGVTVPQGLSGEVTYLGAHNQPIHIGDVIATAGTETTPLGEIGGKGYGFGRSENIQYEAHCHGVLMAIYSCDVDFNYNPLGVDKLLTYVDVNSFFRPEYENLGMELFDRYQCRIEEHRAEPTYATQWVYRYWEQKLKYPRVLGSLAYSLNYWQISKDKPISNNLVDFLVLPDFLDNIMLYKYHHPDNDYDWSDYIYFDNNHGYMFSQRFNFMNYLFERDPLIHELYCDVKLASKKSTYGLPNL